MPTAEPLHLHTNVQITSWPFLGSFVTLSSQPQLISWARTQLKTETCKQPLLHPAGTCRSNDYGYANMLHVKSSRVYARQ